MVSLHFNQNSKGLPLHYFQSWRYNLCYYLYKFHPHKLYQSNGYRKPKSETQSEISAIAVLGHTPIPYTPAFWAIA